MAGISLLTAAAVPLLSLFPPAGALQQGTEILGAWTGGQILQYERPDSQTMFFARRPDGSIALANIYEVGPRARLWSYDIDVTYADGEISWAYHRGTLNPARDTMWVLKDYRGDQSQWMWVRSPDADALIAGLRALENEPYQLEPPPEEDDGWPCSDAADIGLDPDRVTDFLQRVADGNFGDLHSFLLVRNGSLAVEAYFAEDGAKHGSLVSSIFRNRVHHLASTTKAVTSALVGIALERGLLPAVHEPIWRSLAEYAALLQGAKSSITLEHLLTMSSGLGWNPNDRGGRLDDNRAIWAADDVVRYVLAKPLEAEPGRRFVYSNGSAAVVGAVLERATGVGVRAFAEEHLFRPLGITEYLWTSFPDGTVETDGGLALRPRDLAKIGQLYLNGGEWEGDRILRDEWIAASTQSHMPIGSLGGAPWGYGYFWQTTELTTPRGRIPAYFHPGDGGQFLMVIPSLEMVVVFTGGTYAANSARVYNRIMSEFVLPARARLGGGAEPLR